MAPRIIPKLDTDRKKWSDGNGQMLSLQNLLKNKMFVKATYARALFGTVAPSMCSHPSLNRWGVPADVARASASSTPTDQALPRDTPDASGA